MVSNKGADLSGKVALVTGGSRGLGREMVLAFAEAGADLVVASRKISACEEVAAEAREKHGRRASAVACHVGQWDDLGRLVDRAYEEFGQVDVLVNNAGISPLYPSPIEVKEDLWDKVQSVNLKGPFRLTALVGSRMVETGGGSILNISSVVSLRPTPDTIPYAAAKAGLNALTVAFAKAYAPTVRVNAIVAGPMLTDVSKSWDPTTTGALAGALALGRFGQAEEIVGAALYFCGDASSFTTGALLNVDGGAL